MSKMKGLYTGICELIDDGYDDDEIAMELECDIRYVIAARKEYLG